MIMSLNDLIRTVLELDDRDLITVGFIGER